MFELNFFENIVDFTQDEVSIIESINAKELSACRGGGCRK